MTNTITLNVQQGNTTRAASVQVENEQVINCIFPEWSKNSTISESQLTKLQNIAKVGGDMGVLESCDLNSKQKLTQAQLNGYSEYYDISLSSDGKYYMITIKETSLLYPDPKVEDLKKDFGLRENVFIDNNSDKLPPNPTNDARNFDYEKIKGGTTIKLPVEEVSFTNGPAGFWRRLI